MRQLNNHYQLLINKTPILNHFPVDEKKPPTEVEGFYVAWLNKLSKLHVVINKD